MSTPFEFPAVAARHDVTPRIFAEEILPHARPVLLKGLVASWPAVASGRESPQAIASYIKSMDTGTPTTVLEAAPAVKGLFTYGADMHDFNFNKRSKSISAGIDQLLTLLERETPSSVYIQSTPTPQYLPRFISENPNPLLSPRVEPRIWISNRTRAQTHNDNDHNIACVVAGTRRFTLFPPEQVSNLYIGPLDHTPSGRAISLASLETPDFDRFPRLAEALCHAEVADMEPGDAIYIPKYWWHHVQSLSAFNILINYWWGGPGQSAENPMTTFMSALLALKDLPEPERAYWKAMFDHYIFQTDGDPVAHIPREHQSALGPHTPKVRGELLRALQQIVSGH